MKSKLLRLLLAALACSVFQVGTSRAAATEKAKEPSPEPVTYKVTLTRTLSNGEVINRSSTYSTAESETIFGSIPLDWKDSQKAPLIIQFELSTEGAEFEVMDTSLMRQGISKDGGSYSYPQTILESNVRRKKSDNYTLLETESQKLTITFKKVDPKELDEVPVAKEAEGKK